MTVEGLNNQHYEVVLDGKDALDTYRKHNPDVVLMLKDADFLNVRLSGFDLSKANLLGANFQLADLQGADLQGANLLGADLLGANLRHANLQGANLRGANLQEADLTGADLTGANFLVANMMESVLVSAIAENVNIKGANLQRAQMEGINFKNAILDECNLLISNLQSADLTGASLKNSKLQGANLQKAVLCYADFSDSDLERVDLQESDLNNAICSRVNLSSSNLLVANLSEARILHSNLSRAVLKRANFMMADLSFSNLQFSDLVNADLQGVEFKKSDLRGADMSGANLQLADFTNANLQEAVLTEAKFSKAVFVKANLQNSVFDSKSVLKKLKVPLTEMQINQILFKDELNFRKVQRKELRDGRLKVFFTKNILWNPKELSRLLEVLHGAYMSIYFLINSPSEDRDLLRGVFTNGQLEIMPWKHVFVENIQLNPFMITLGTIDFRDTEKTKGFKKPAEILKIMGMYLNRIFNGKENVMNLYDVELGENCSNQNCAENIPVEMAAQVLKRITEKLKITQDIHFDDKELEKNKDELFSYSMATVAQYSDWASRNGFGFLNIEYVD